MNKYIWMELNSDGNLRDPSAFYNMTTPLNNYGSGFYSKKDAVEKLEEIKNITSISGQFALIEVYTI